jgi:ATP-dependent RNA helicase DeaD
MPHTFAELGIADDILRTIHEVGYEEPTPIQRQAIPILLAGRDVMAQSQTGTGKTAAFAVPMLQLLDPSALIVQGLVLTPTRELAVQVAGTIHKLGKSREVFDLPIYGGQPYDRQLRALKRGVHVVVGTPGRIMDHMRRGTLDLSQLRMLVLDEADQMLDMGFIEDIEFILEALPPERQVALFSATLPPRIRTLAKQYMHDPETLAIAQQGLTVPEVTQQYVETTRQGKLDALTRILDMDRPESAIVFVRTKKETDELGETLAARGYGVEVIHGDLNQAQRERTIAAFRGGRTDILVATDVASRGLDIPNVSHVINYDIPDDPEAYVHRIGRTARAGKEGIAVTFVTPRERNLLQTIERLIRVRLSRKRVPTLADIAEKRAQLYCDSLRESIADGHLERYMSIVEDLGGEFDLAEVAAAAIKMALEEQIGALDGQDELESETGMQRLFLRAGRRDGVSARDIVGAIANEAKISGREIGAVDIYDKFLFVDVPKRDAGRIVEALTRSGIRGRRVPVSVAVPEGKKA